MIRTGEGNHSKRDQGQQDPGDQHSNGDRLGQGGGVVAQAAGQLGDRILGDVAEDGNIEYGHRISPVGVDRPAHIRLAGEKGDADNDSQQNDHAGAEELFRQASGLQTKPDDQDRGDGKEQAAHCGRKSQQLTQNIAAAGGVRNHASDRVGAHRDKDQNSAQLSNIALRQTGQLHGLLGAEGGLRHIQHGDGGTYTGRDQPHQQNGPAGLSRGIGQPQDPCADVGADNDHGRLPKCELLDA